MPDASIWIAAADIVRQGGDRDSIDYHLLAACAPAVFAGDGDALRHWRMVADAIDAILQLAGAC